MPTHKRQSLVRVAMLVLAIASVLTCVNTAHAATRNWSGAAGNGLWSDPGNWVGGVAPVAGDDLVFGQSTPTPTNDFPANTLFNSISLGSLFGTSQITGNPIVLGAGGLMGSSANGGQNAALGITLGASQTWSVISSLGGTLTVSGGVHLNGQTLTLSSSERAPLTISGVIDGAGALIIDGVFREISLSGANTFSGPVTVVKGALRISNATALGVADGTLGNGTVVTGNSSAGLTLDSVAIGNEALSLTGTGGLGSLTGPSSVAGPITLAGSVARISAATPAPLTLTGAIGGSATLGLTGPITLANGGNSFTANIDMRPFGFGTGNATLTIDADHALPGDQTIDMDAGNTFVVNGRAQTVRWLTGAGTVSLVGAASALTLDGNGEAVLTGPVTGTGTIRYTGANYQAFNGANTFNGTLIVDHGTVKVIGAPWPAATTVNNDGHFSIANATVGAITVNDGSLLLSEGGASNVTSGTLTLDSAAHVTVGATAPSALSKLTVTGGVTLGNAKLTLLTPAGFAPVLNTAFTLIDNDGTDAVNGTFAGLPEGEIFTVGTVAFRVSYVGGDGNDVVLTTTTPPLEYLLSEGATSNFFRTDVLLANPTSQAAPVRITFLKDDGTSVVQNTTLAPMSHQSMTVNDVAGMSGTSFSTVVRSTDNVPLVVERTMSWDRSSYGAHTEHATEGTNTTWYFAEGSQGFFHTYLLLANPGASPNIATVQFLPEFTPAFTRTYQLTPQSRLTVDAASEPGVLNQSFGMVVTFDQPGAAERAMYFGLSPLFNGGHESAGATAPATTWFLAEGATGSFFETFILLANPGNTDAIATMTYLPAAGTPVVTTRTVPAHTRVTVNIATEDPSLTSAAVSTQVTSTQPILVERSQYWPNPASNWYEAHNSFGVTSLGTKWGLAEGRVGNVDGITAAQTFILLANPGTTPANVTVTFLRDDPATNITKTFTVDPTSRFNVHVGPGNDVPELNDEHFGALITSDQPIAVERALYWDANNQVWAAGTGATATKLP